MNTFLMFQFRSNDKRLKLKIFVKVIGKRFREHETNLKAFKALNFLLQNRKKKKREEERKRSLAFKYSI